MYVLTYRRRFFSLSKTAIAIQSVLSFFNYRCYIAKYPLIIARLADYERL